jgi:hypothetical protein
MPTSRRTANRAAWLSTVGGFKTLWVSILTLRESQKSNIMEELAHELATPGNSLKVGTCNDNFNLVAPG